MNGHRGRYLQGAEVLSRHGLGFLVGVAGLERWVPFHRGLLGHERRDLPYTKPEHVRLALEQLGPVFVKLGQVLSTRPDLLPEGYQLELARLQDDAPPVPGDVIRDLVREELGCEAEEAFAFFDFVPLASASIGQAHAARLLDGTEVVVKVRRPGVVEQVNEDLEILGDLAARAGRRWEAAADYDLVGLVEEFAATLLGELDYLQEGRNVERIAENFAGDPEVHIPRVFWKTTTSAILTLERIHGVKVSDAAGLQEADIDRRLLARRATQIACKMIFEDGFFHADPHPGNLFIEPGGRIGLIDFGMVGEVDDTLRRQLADLLLALTRSDPNRLTSAVLDMAVARGEVDRLSLRRDLAAVLERYSGHPIGEIPVGPLISEVMVALRRERLQLSRELALLLKMLVMTEGMGVMLDPEFRLGEVLGPYAEQLVAERFSPGATAHRLKQTGMDLAELGLEIREQLRRVLSLLERGGFDVHLRADELAPLVTRAVRAANRVVVGLVAAALIEGVAELVAADPQRRVSWRRPFLLASLGGAGSLSAYLAWTARTGPTRSRR